MRALVVSENANFVFSSAGNFICNNRWIHSKRVVSTYEMIFVVKGVLHICANGVYYNLEPNDFLLLWPQELHFGTEENQSDLSFFWLHFSVDEGAYTKSEGMAHTSLDDRTPHLTIPEHIHVFHSQRILIYLKDLMHYVASQTDSKLPLKICSQLILYEISQEFRFQSVKDSTAINQIKVTDEICEYIRANLQTELSVSGIASHFGYNEKYFISLFHRCTGFPPKQYILESRINHAKMLLANTNLYIKEIALQVAFNDTKCFCKCFKKREGITPTEYRNLLSGTHYNTK